MHSGFQTEVANYARILELGKSMNEEYIDSHRVMSDMVKIGREMHLCYLFQNQKMNTIS